jgi:hypothetical protein
LGTCVASKADGEPCQAEARAGGRHCPFHDPLLAAERAEGRRRGGAERSRPRVVLSPEHAGVQVRTVGDVCGLVSDTIGQVRTGALDPRIANTVGYLCTVLIRALELSKLEDRLRALEEAVRRSTGPGESAFDRHVSVEQHGSCHGHEEATA